MAGNVMSLVPMLVVFFVAQRFFVRSVAATGLSERDRRVPARAARLLPEAPQ